MAHDLALVAITVVLTLGLVWLAFVQLAREINQEAAEREKARARRPRYPLTDVR